MVSFTPGPWFPHWNGHYFTIDVGPQEFDPSVATVHMNHVLSLKDDDVKANAQLIAASPDLFEAATNLVERYRSVNWNKPDTEMYIKALEAAVEKARGE